MFITFINLSNVVHLSENIKNTLKYHSNYFTNQNVIPSIKNFIHKASALKLGPIYLSFPSGSKEQFSRIGKKTLKSIDPDSYTSPLLMDYFNYCTIIPSQFLKAIETGTMITSLKNIALVKNKNTRYDLKNSRYFFDIPNGKILDLKIIRDTYGIKNLIAQKINGKIFEKAFYLKDNTNYIK